LDELLGRFFISLFLILLFGIRLSSQRVSRDKGLRYFWLTVITCLLLIVQDYTEMIASENPDLIFWRTLLSIAGYFLRSVASASLVMAVLKPERRTMYVWAPCLLVLLACATAFFTDIAFGFDEEYHFYRGPLGYICFVVPMAYLAAILWITYKRYGDVGQTADRLILMKEGTIAAEGTPEEIYGSGSTDKVFEVRLCRAETAGGWRYHCEERER